MRLIVKNLKTDKMVVVIMPMSDGRIATLLRYAESKDDMALILNRLGMALPIKPPSKIIPQQDIKQDKDMKQNIKTNE